MRVNLEIPIQFRGPLEVIGPIGNQVRPEYESYALFSPNHGAIGYWPKLDAHPDGTWRLTEAEAQFMADACNEKMERERAQLGMEVRESQCRYGCDDNREIEDVDGNTWPCPLHGDHAQGRKNDDPIGPNMMTGELMSGEAIYSLMLEIASRAYRVARGSEYASMQQGQVRQVVDSVLLPKPERERALARLMES